MYVPAILESEDDVFAGTHFNDPKPISGERALWLGVVARVWDDAYSASDAFLKQSEGKLSEPAITRAEARRWLTLGFGDWAVDRQTVCDLADISEPMLRRAARRRLADQIKAGAKPTAEVIQLDTLFAQLLADADGMSATDIDAAIEKLAALESKAA